MARSVQGKRIEEYNHVCHVAGRQGDYVRIGKPGGTNTRVARANLAGRVIEEESFLVPTGDVVDIRKFGEMLAQLLTPQAPPLPAHNIGRYDDEVKALVQREAVPLEDTFNSALRRLLGLDPARPNVNSVAPTA